MKAQHSSATGVWGTSRAWVDIARVVLGRLDLDPFSDPQWNTIVGARRILTERDDSFTCPWFDGAPRAADVLADDGVDPGEAEAHTALANPPGDPTGDCTKRAWQLVEWHHRVGWLGGGVVWVAFNIGQLQTLQNADAPRSLLAADFLRCIPSTRVAYEERADTRTARLAAFAKVRADLDAGKAKGKRLAELRKKAVALAKCASPPHASAIVLLPAHGAAGDEQRAMFRMIAGRQGEVF